MMGYDGQNYFTCLPVEPTPDNYADCVVMSDSLSVLISAMKIPGTIHTSHNFHLVKLFLPFPELSIAIPFLISMPFPLPLWMESHCCSLLYCLHLLPAQI